MPVRQLLAKIHIAKKELGLSDETYRDALEGQTGKRSAAEMTNDQIARCLRHFQKLGWTSAYTNASAGKPKKYDDQKGDIYSATPQQKRKIEAMWHDLYRGNDETRHLRQFLFNHFKVSDIRFLDKRVAYDVIEGLKAMQRRRTPWNTEPDSTGQGRHPDGVPCGVSEAATPQGQTPRGKEVKGEEGIGSNE